MKDVVQLADESNKKFEDDEENFEKLEECLQNFRIRIADEIEKMDPFWYENTNFLLRFIRVKKCNEDKALIMLKNYLTFRKKNSKYLINLSPSAYKFLYDLGIYTILKKRDPFGRQVFFVRTENWDPNEISLDQIISSTALILEEMLESEETQRNGVVIVADLTGCTLQHFFKVRLGHIRSMISIFQGNFPMKFKGLHCVNEPGWHRRLTAFAKPLFPSKLQKRIHFNGKDYESMHQLLPPEILPHSLGGTLTWDEANDAEFFEKLYSREEYYQHINLLDQKINT